MQLVLIAMMASGYRPSTNEPGHHQTMIQSLPLTLGLPNTTWVVVDALRRNATPAITRVTRSSPRPEAVSECIAQATALLATTRRWLAEHHPSYL